MRGRLTPDKSTLSALTHSLLLRDRLLSELERVKSSHGDLSTPSISAGGNHRQDNEAHGHAHGNVEKQGQSQSHGQTQAFRDEWDLLEDRKRREREREKEVEEREREVSRREKWVVDEMRWVSLLLSFVRPGDAVFEKGTS